MYARNSELGKAAATVGVMLKAEAEEESVQTSDHESRTPVPQYASAHSRRCNDSGFHTSVGDDGSN